MKILELLKNFLFKKTVESVKIKYIDEDEAYRQGEIIGMVKMFFCVLVGVIVFYLFGLV